MGEDVAEPPAGALDVFERDLVVILDVMAHEKSRPPLLGSGF